MRKFSFLTLPHLKSRALLWSAAGAVGVAAVAFAELADLAQQGLRHLVQRAAWAPWVLAPFGFAVITWATRRYFRGAEGSGIPQTIYAQRADSGERGRLFMRPIVVVGRVLLAAAGLACGASIGREGPTVHVGAVILNAVARFMPHDGPEVRQRTMILAGGAAGVAAAFNTPLAGIVFAIEELARSFEEHASGAVLTTVILAGMVAIALVGDYTYFGHPAVPAAASSINGSVIVLALGCGVLGGSFSRLTLLTSADLPEAVMRWRRDRPVAFAAACGIGIAAIGTATGGLTYGTGYEEARAIMETGTPLGWSYAPARAAATLLSYLSGIPAGLLAPSLSVGAGVGQWFAGWLGHASMVTCAILGMCGYLAGVTQAPLTSFVIVMEMTAQHAMLLPLMVTAAIATAVSKLFSPPLYQSLAERYAAPG